MAAQRTFDRTTELADLGLGIVGALLGIVGALLGRIGALLGALRTLLHGPEFRTQRRWHDRIGDRSARVVAGEARVHGAGDAEAVHCSATNYRDVVSRASRTSPRRHPTVQ